MKTLQGMAALALVGLFAISCANKRQTASADNNPYQNNPYYSGTDSSSSASSAGSATYPTYTDSNPYTPPSPEPSYSDNSTGGGYTGGTNYPGYTGSSNPYPYTNDGTARGGGSTHTVAKGENLYRISLRYGTSVSALQQANGLNDTTIYPGQVLTIP